MAYGMHVPEIRIAMQRFGLLGLSYRTADQGAIARAAARAPSAEAIRKMHDDCGLGESLYLATCNRVEWVIVAPEEVEPGACLHLLERRLQLDPAQCYRLTGEAAARHVFEVAASLDSMNPGETYLPFASIRRLPANVPAGLIAAIFPCIMPMSPQYQGLPHPSNMRPLLITIS